MENQFKFDVLIHWYELVFLLANQSNLYFV